RPGSLTPSRTSRRSNGWPHPTIVTSAHVTSRVWRSHSSTEMNLRSPSYKCMPLSSGQKGAIGQFAFLAAALATGNGQVEGYTPAADNEGRDAEIRRHLKGSPGISIQIKVALITVSLGEHHRQKYLEIRFDQPKEKNQDE